MKKTFALVLAFSAVLLRAGTAFSLDYGLTLRSLPVLTNGEPGINTEYTGTAVPWFAAPLGEWGDLYLSGGISAEYSGEEWKPVPEVYRFELTCRFDAGTYLALGRLSYREPLNLIMNGLFDGLAFSYDLGKTRLSAGAFFTGLLYKKTAYITISSSDYTDYADKDVYFASRRLVFALGWAIPDIAGSEGRLDLGFAGQFDLNEPDNVIGGGGKVHFQYLPAKLTLPFLNYFNAELGALVGMVEEDGRDPGFCFALSGGLAWLPPGGVNDRLFLNAALSSGAWNRRTRAFLPVNTIAQGKVLRPKLSGLALMETGYTVRLHQTLSADAGAAYFFRTDTHTYDDPKLDGTSRSPLLGGEISSTLAWAPVSDISLNLGGGVFFPLLGKSFVRDAPLRWRISLETILSF